MLKTLLTAAAVCAALLTAGAKELNRWTFGDAKSVSECGWYNSKETAAKRSFDPSEKPGDGYKGSMLIEIEKGGRVHPSSITPFFVSREKIRAGERYEVSILLKTETPQTFTLHCMLNQPPWDPLRKGFRYECKTVGGRWERVTFQFEADMDTANNMTVRVPVLFLGHLGPGTKLWIAEVRFSGPDSAAPAAGKASPPETRAGSRYPIRDFQSLLKWRFADAWRREDGGRMRVSLNQFWQFAPTGSDSDKAPETWGFFFVPGHWRGGNLSNFMRLPDGSEAALWNGKAPAEYEHAWYRRTVDLPEAWKSGKVMLDIELIPCSGGSFFVNGQKVETEPLEYGVRIRKDITGLLRFGGENEFLFRLDATVPHTKAGLVSNVWLDYLPKANLGEPEIRTSLDRKAIDVRFHGAAVPDNARIAVEITDAKDGAKVFEKTLPCGERLSLDFVTPKLWSPDDPNLYNMTFTLLAPDGKTLDRFSRRFGFREFKVSGGRYLLNGNPVQLKADTGVCGQTGVWSIDWHNNPEYFRSVLKSLKKMNLNAIYFELNGPAELYDIADEEGVFVLIQHALGYQYNFDNTDETVLARVRRELEADRVNPAFFRHPCQVGFLIDVWFNFHSGTTNPEYVGLKYGTKNYPAFAPDGRIVTKTKSDPNLASALLKRKQRLDRIVELYREYFPAFTSFTGGSGEVGGIYATHTYHTWGAPTAELRGLFSRWALQRELPIFIGETTLPYPGSFYSINNFTAAGSDPLYMENAARLDGNRAYQFKGVYGRRALHDHDGESLQSNTGDNDGLTRYYFAADLYTSALTRFLEETISGWRLNGVNGYGMFCYVLGQHFVYAGQVPMNWQPDYSGNLSAPFCRPDLWQGGAHFSPVDVRPPYPGNLRPAESAAPLARLFGNVFCAFYGGGADELAQDHAWFGGDTLRKKLVLMNDAPRAFSGRCRISLFAASGALLSSEEREFSAAPFERKAVPVELGLPSVAVRSEFLLKAEFIPKEGDAVTAEFPLEVFPRPEKAPLLRAKLYVFDPEGKLAPALTRLGYAFQPLKDLNDLPEKGILVIGRRGLKLSRTVPDFNALASSGLNILILEQEATASPELMKRRIRTAFINAAGHPALRGFADRDFTHWGGNRSILPAYAETGEGQGWADNGNANMLAGLVFRRPAHGSYRSLLASGFDLFQTPLLEYFGRKGSWIGCQLEMTERLGTDPVPTILLANLLSYLDTRGEFRSGTAFFGGEKGRAFLDRMKVGYTAVPTPAGIRNFGALIIADPDWKELEKYRFEIADFVYRGGRLYYLHGGGDFSSTWLPFALGIGEVEARQAQRRSDSPDSLWRCGWDNNDLYWHDSRKLQAFTGVAGQDDSVSPAVLVRRKYGSGEFILTTLRPELFGETPAAGKTCRLLSALLASGGVGVGNSASPYTVKSGEMDITLDLSSFGWEFSTDPGNRGLEEGWQLGKNGSGAWMRGLVADGIEVTVGQPFEKFLRKEYDGWAWYRLALNLDAEVANSPGLYFHAGAIDDFDEVYINGVKIGQTGKETPQYWLTPRLYRIPAGVLKKGRNLIAVRVFDEKLGGGIVKLPLAITNRPSEGAKAWTTPYPEGSARDYEYKSDVIRQY